MSDIVFVSAFRDIGRSNWATQTRTTADYIQYFVQLASNIQYTLVVFVDDATLSILSTSYSFQPNIIFKQLSSVNTFYDKYLEQDKKIINSTEYKNKIPAARKQHAEHLYAEYNFINHSKINFIRETQRQYPEYEFYAWIDFGFVREMNALPRPPNIECSKLPTKIICHCINNPSKQPNQEKPEKKDATAMLASFEIFITGGAFIVHSTLVSTFEYLYENKIQEWQREYITDDDQNLMLQLYYDNPNMFYLIQSDEWFSLYNILPI